jgi:antitoxin PrlF
LEKRTKKLLDMSALIGKENPYFSSMITSRLTSKAQATIPQAVRSALSLRAGDELAYVIEQSRVVLTRVDRGAQADDPFAVFAEWNSEADAHAYADI